MTYSNDTYGGSSLGSTTLVSPERDRSAVYRVIRDGSVIEDAVYDVDPLVDTANPFGDYCVIKIDDRAGEKFENYARGTRIDVAVSEGYDDAFTNRFTGYVVERREVEQGGADALEVEAYSFDQFLRRNTVTNDQTGNTITQALEDIITTDTPVTWVAGNVSVGDEQELTRSYQGEPVEQVLRDFAFKSTNENFGVNDSLEFFFRPRETVHIDRGIDNTQWFNYDIPELGKEAINEVEVWFDDGNESVIVDDGTDKLDLQDSLGLDSPGTQRAELNRPLLTDISDAEDEGRKYLEFRNSTLSGTITTFGLYDAEPGDTIDITIQPRGIDSEFVIASTEYRWGVDETRLTIVEKRGAQDDILFDLNDSVQRVEMNGANRDAPKNRITTTNATAIIDVSVDADGNTPTDTRFVNDGRNKVRDGWTGKPNPAISNIVVGSDGSGLSRSNTALLNQTNSVAVSESLPSAKVVEYSATVTQTGVQELGLETSDGTLMTRVVFDSPVDLNGTVTVTLTVSNDDSVSRGVLTNDGQTAVRDVLADNSPNTPTDYAYGSDGTAVAESDTALGNELVSVSLEDILLQSADDQQSWLDILASTFPDNEPLEVNATGPTMLQLAFTQDNPDASQESPFGAETNPDFTGGEAAALVADGDFARYEFTLDYTIPADSFEFAFRFSTGGTTDGIPAFSVYLNHDNGTQYKIGGVDNGGFTVGLTWRKIISNPFNTYPYEGPDLTPGDYSVRVEVDTPGGALNDSGLFVDVAAPYDFRYDSELFFDNDNGGSGGFLDGPEKFRDTEVLSFETATTRRNVTEANVVSTWNNVDGSQYIELANDGSTFTRTNNSETASVTFGSGNRDVDANVALSRYSDGTNATPLNGNQGQQIDTWELFANPDAVLADAIGVANTRAVVAPNTTGVVNETVREAGLKNGSVLLTRHELAEFDLLPDQRLASSESTLFTGTN